MDEKVGEGQLDFVPQGIYSLFAAEAGGDSSKLFSPMGELAVVKWNSLQQTFQLEEFGWFTALL